MSAAAYSSAVDRETARFRGKSEVSGQADEVEKEKEAVYDGSVSD